MRVNTAIGEVGLTINGRDYLLRPSFVAMSQIGEGDSLVSIANWANQAKLRLQFEPHLVSVLDISTALLIIQSCCDDEIVGLGHIVGSEWTGKLVFNEQEVCWQDLIIIAEHLIRYGINGIETERSKNAARFSDKRDNFVFKVSEFVASAIAHLKLSAKDAWQLTMPEFQMAIDALFPEDGKKSNMPTQEDMQKNLAIIKAARERHAKTQKDKPEVKKASNNFVRRRL
jgi:hypothetical protein